jgi:AcrR family transcriptional regulator
MAQCVGRKGFADTTIADVVTAARVSRRTFYEHFESREACLIALYEAASAHALRELSAAIDPARDWRVQINEALRRYLAVLAEQPTLLRTLFVAVFVLGDAGLAARRRANDRLVQFIIDTARSGAPTWGSAAPSREMATALVGGINELILQAIEDQRVDRLTDLVPAAAELVVRILDRPAGAC